MSSKFSNILNVVLIIAVAGLYYLHFSDCNSSCKSGDANDSSAAPAPIVLSPKEIKATKIVYVNSDVLNEKYEYVKELASAAQAKQQRLEMAYQTKGQKLQQDFMEFQQKASQGLLSENQVNATQAELTKRKEELDQMEMQLQSMMQEIQRDNEQVRKTVTDYVKEYNKQAQYNYVLTYSDGPGGVLLLANDSMDITNEILEGLNAQYRAKKANKK